MSAAGPAAARGEPPTAAGHHCPLCGGSFAQEEHCSICPMTAYCNTLCCPHCGYAYVERSSVVDLIRRLFGRRARRARGGPAGGHRG
ncbi:MAG: hypothetical protein ACE5JH_06900 [Acidobacteriota bacterium]